jgi:hypothetical protein
MAKPKAVKPEKKKPIEQYDHRDKNYYISGVTIINTIKHVTLQLLGSPGISRERLTIRYFLI